MSDGQRSRRRFLADLLFLGGALGAGAFLMQAGDPAAPAQPAPAPPSPTPKSPSCPPAVDGDVGVPRLAPVEPHIEGEVAPPPPPSLNSTEQPPVIKGKVSLPEPGEQR